MRIIRRILLTAMAICLCLSLCEAGLAAEDPPVVRVGEVVYPLSVVQFAVDPYFELAEIGEEELTEEEKQEIVDQVIQHIIGLGVIENKLIETGHNIFTEDETDILRSEAARRYEQAWQHIRQEYTSAGESIPEAEITSWMNERGYTQEAYLRELMTSEREGRILDLYCADVSVTEEEVQQYYLDSFLNPDREKYEHDIPLYEKEILIPGNEAFFTPEGYRYIKNILLAFPDEIQEALNAMNVDGNRAVRAVQKAYNRLAEAAAAGEDIAPYKEAYDQKLAALREQEALYRAKEQEAIPLLRETIDLIRNQFQDGISIETILKEYSLDQQQTGTDKPGALYHPDSTLWPEKMKKVIDAMEKPGELSEACVDETGVHLIYYAGDAPGGERILNAEEQQMLRDSALYNAQTEKLEKLIEAWKQDYEIAVDASLIRVP